MRLHTHLQSSFSVIFLMHCLCHVIGRCRYVTEKIGLDFFFAYFFFVEFLLTFLSTFSAFMSSFFVELFAEVFADFFCRVFFCDCQNGGTADGRYCWQGKLCIYGFFVLYEGFLLSLTLSFNRNVYKLFVFSSSFVNSFTKEDGRRKRVSKREG